MLGWLWARASLLFISVCDGALGTMVALVRQY